LRRILRQQSGRSSHKQLENENMSVIEELERGLFGLDVEFSFVMDCLKHLEVDGNTRAHLLKFAEKLATLADKVTLTAQTNSDQNVSY